VKNKLLTAYNAAEKTFKVHLDGFNQLPYLTGQQPEISAHRVLLFQRRRRSGGDADGRLEVSV